MARLPARTIAIRGLLAAALAAVGNVALVGVADALSVAPNLTHLAYGRVAVFTIGGVLAAMHVVAAIVAVYVLTRGVGERLRGRFRRPTTSSGSRTPTSTARRSAATRVFLDSLWGRESRPKTDPPEA